MIEGDADAAAALREELINYPLLITRDLDQARAWLRSRRRGEERAGLLASSNAARLKPHGEFVKAKISRRSGFSRHRMMCAPQMPLKTRGPSLTCRGWSSTGHAYAGTQICDEPEVPGRLCSSKALGGSWSTMVPGAGTWQTPTECFSPGRGRALLYSCRRAAPRIKRDPRHRTTRCMNSSVAVDSRPYDTWELASVEVH